MLVITASLSQTLPTMMRPTLVLALLVSTASASIPDAIRTIKAVDREAKGNSAASAAWQQLADAPATELPALLAALDGANPLAENWLRAAISSIEDRAAAEKALPVQALESFIKTIDHSPSARTLAFDILLRHAPSTAEALSSTFLDDPSAELRRHPIARLIAEADSIAATNKDKAIGIYKKALTSARDEDQIKPITKKLRDLGQTVDLPKHFGFLMDWTLIAPFNNAEGIGHNTVYAPEKELNLQAKYPGKGKEAGWVAFKSEDEYGKIDFNKPFGMEKEVTGYATTDFYSAEERAAEIRLGCKNAWKVWLNGKLVFERDEYHRGAKLDQYKLPCTLKKGKNTLLVKCSQNHQKEEWTVEWEFQLRICDSTGTAIASAKE